MSLRIVFNRRLKKETEKGGERREKGRYRMNSWGSWVISRFTPWGNGVGQSSNWFSKAVWGFLLITGNIYRSFVCYIAWVDLYDQVESITWISDPRMISRGKRVLRALMGSFSDIVCAEWSVKKCILGRFLSTPITRGFSKYGISQRASDCFCIIWMW